MNAPLPSAPGDPPTPGATAAAAATGWAADALPLLLAGSVAGGAWAARPVPPAVFVAMGLAALCARSRMLVVVVAALAASALGAHASAGLEPPPSQRFDGTVTLLSDPDPVPGGVRVDVKAGARHSEMWVRGAQALPVRTALAGEVVHVTGWLEPVRDQPWLHRRHIATRLAAETLGPVQPGSPVTQVANAVRQTLQRGASHLPDDLRSLYLGIVLGDDRGQSDAMVDTFRAAGLTHLLVVSGQNVGFVLVLVGPLLGRLQLRSRLVGTISILVFFALLTRFEPSVLRATVMAGLAATAGAMGRPTSRLRLLALAVTILLLADPFLVRSAGFGLSVSACVGIIVLAPPIEARLRGPRVLVEPLAVTLAAQIGVAPLLIPLFGGVPLASVPANLLAGPAAGFVMMWGLTAGIVAGIAPPLVARVLTVPTAMGVRWIDGVAGWASELPLGQVDARGGVGLLALVAVAALARRRFRRSGGGV